jgi:hypothetical protein
MRAIVTRKFKDKYSSETHLKGEVLEISEDRYNEIQSVGDFVNELSPNVQDDESPPGGDSFDEMSIRELREYADKAYKLTFKNGMKKSEIIEELRRREQHG